MYARVWLPLIAAIVRARILAPRRCRCVAKLVVVAAVRAGFHLLCIFGHSFGFVYGIIDLLRRLRKERKVTNTIAVKHTVLCALLLFLVLERHATVVTLCRGFISADHV